jgi:putative methyltransferase (TIGR01177 family)
MHLIVLSGENLKLARLEAETLLKLENTKLEDNYLYCTIPTESMKLIDRLSFTKKLYEIMYVTAKKNLEISLKTYPWINYYEKNFCVRITSSEHYDERHYAGFVWQSLEKSTRPAVSLDNPQLLIEIFVIKERCTVTRLLYQNFEMYESRKAHLKPILHPTAMHPKMARALINIVNAPTVVDPFCGACGILTEAGLIGIKFIGYDIDKNILESARKNLEFYDINPKHYKLIVKDSTTIKNLQNVVTDLPYGKSSKKSEELITLYAKFLKNLSGRAVIVMPNFMPYKKLLDKNLPKSLTVLTIIDHYVHKSLTRKIIVIDKKNSSKNITKKTEKVITKNTETSKKKSKSVKRKVKTIKKKVVVKKKKLIKYNIIKKLTKHVKIKHKTPKKKIVRKKHKKFNLKRKNN